jgi:D-3-phosphoglycerate dehydrogenase
MDKILAMKVLVADKFEDVGLKGISEAGFECVYLPDVKDDSLIEAIKHEKPDVLVVRSTRVTSDALLEPLKLVIRAGAGYNTIDVETARERGIQVANCPGKNANAVAELTFGLILALDRRIPDNVIALREGRWDKKEYGKAKGIAGRTIGIIGMGAIGQLVAKIALAFGLRVLVFSRHLTPAEASAMGVELVASLSELAQRSDIVSVHVALGDQTKGLIDDAFFKSMKEGAFFVNTSRSEVIDQAALLEAIEQKGIRAALDVFDEEPSSPTGEYSGALREKSNVYCTHHIGASTEQAQNAVAEETVRIIREFAKTGRAPNCVNCG